VECYAGYRGEEMPRRFGFAGAKIEIAEVVDRWLAPDHRYFKVRDGDGDSRCPTCRCKYWQGSHYSRMSLFIETAFAAAMRANRY
jgi:uncharacterized protein with PIN domain